MAADPSRRWHRTYRGTHWGSAAIRLGGAVLIAVAWLAGSALRVRVDHLIVTGALDDALMAITFLSASAGMAAMVMGGHLFDQVPIAERWRSSR